MGLVAEYKITTPHLPLVAVAASVPEMTLDVTVGQPNQGGPPPFIVDATGEATSALEDAFERAAFVDSYSLVDGGDTARYKLTPAATMADQLGDRVDDFATLEALATNESIVERITVQPDGWRQKRWFADRAAFLAYWEFWRENARSFSLYRLSESDSDANPATGLTDRQREALRTAHEMGYFEIPRTTSLDAVATELGISAPALSGRLRRAHTHLIEQTL